MDWWQYQITQGFGPTSEQLDGGYAGYDHFNKGIDFAAPLGTPVRSLVSGTVISAGDSADGWGTSVKIRDANGNTHNLGHLSAANVQPGQTILAGQLVGASGSTGKSTGPHVSYDVWDPAGNFFDPYQFIQQAPGASPPMTMEDPLIDQYTGGGTTTAPRTVGYDEATLLANGGTHHSLGNIVANGTLYQRRDDNKFYPVYTQLNPPNTADDAKIWGNQEIAALPGFVGAKQVGPNLFVEYEGGYSQVFTQKAGGWSASTVKMPSEEAAKRFYSIGAAASPGTPAGSNLSAPSGAPNANQWDSLAIANAVSGGQGGQKFSQVDGKGYVTKTQDLFAQNIAANQYNNNDFVLRSYGIDTSKPDWQDPLRVATAAATLGARQKYLVDQGYDPTFAASLIQQENASNIAKPLSQPLNMQSPYGQGQGIIAGNALDPLTGASQHTYSAEFARQYPHLVV
jgi:hypothetical protein